MQNASTSPKASRTDGSTTATPLFQYGSFGEAIGAVIEGAGVALGRSPLIAGDAETAQSDQQLIRSVLRLWPTNACLWA